MAPDLNCGVPFPCHPTVVSRTLFAEAAARYIADALMAATGPAQLPVFLGLSGGKSPRPVYQLLARIPGIAWRQVVILFADERAVPPDHEGSNYRLVKESLLDRLPQPVLAVHRMEADRSDLARAAAEYEQVLPGRLDVLVLGIGEDGHTASLFPRHPVLAETRRRVLGVQHPGTSQWRITITPPVIEAARARVMLAAGEAKAEAVARACQGVYDPTECPAQLAREGTWIVDQLAASRLRPFS
jgi:6-phosphogluconolactonase